MRAADRRKIARHAKQQRARSEPLTYVKFLWLLAAIAVRIKKTLSFVAVNGANSGLRVHADINQCNPGGAKKKMAIKIKKRAINCCSSTATHEFGAHWGPSELNSRLLNSSINRRSTAY